MSVLDGASTGSLLHEGGEAFIYKVDAGGKSYILKWYAKNSRFDASVVDKLCTERIPGIYRVVESGEKAGRGYLLYDFIEGLSFAEIGAQPVAFAISLVRKMVKSLSGLSRIGIHHGDLNPANAIVDASAGVTLIDCGIVGPGALAYAAPERIQGHPADEKSDIYSLGLLLYRLVAGEDLIACDTYEGFAQAAAQIDSRDPTEILYGKGIDAESLSGLVPLWKASLRADPSLRAEDLEEFDELLEIAFKSLSIGDVTWETMRKTAVGTISDKIGTICPVGQKQVPLPPEFIVTKPTGHSRVIPFVCILGIILLLLTLFFVLSPKEPSIDETGEKILLNSRTSDGATSLSTDSAIDTGHVSGEILEKLPLPQRSE